MASTILIILSAVPYFKSNTGLTVRAPALVGGAFPSGAATTAPPAVGAEGAQAVDLEAQPSQKEVVSPHVSNTDEVVNSPPVAGTAI